MTHAPVVEADDLILTPPGSVSSATILAGLRKLHPPREWAFFEEMRVGTGFGAQAEGRIDAWAMPLWPSQANLRTAYEVKISRSDFAREVAQPRKRRMALHLSNCYYFATPPGLVRPEELPVEAGLVEVAENGKMEIVVPALIRDTCPPSWRFVASLCRHIAAEEGKPGA